MSEDRLRSQMDELVGGAPPGPVTLHDVHMVFRNIPYEAIPVVRFLAPVFRWSEEPITDSSPYCAKTLDEASSAKWSLFIREDHLGFYGWAQHPNIEKWRVQVSGIRTLEAAKGALETEVVRFVSSFMVEIPNFLRPIDHGHRNYCFDPAPGAGLIRVEDSEGETTG